jgi:hypothetical protein
MGKTSKLRETLQMLVKLDYRGLEEIQDAAVGVTAYGW